MTQSFVSYTSVVAIFHSEPETQITYLTMITIHMEISIHRYDSNRLFRTLKYVKCSLFCDEEDQC